MQGDAVYALPFLLFPMDFCRNVLCRASTIHQKFWTGCVTIFAEKDRRAVPERGITQNDRNYS